MNNNNLDDPLLPYLLSIRKELENSNPNSIEEEEGKGKGSSSCSDLHKLLRECITTFKSDIRYQNDLRFLKIWFIYMDCCEDHQRVFMEMEENKICRANSLFYETYALFLEIRGNLIDAVEVYCLGISRNAAPLDRLKKAQRLFLDRVSEIVNSFSLRKSETVEGYANPWSKTVIKDMLAKMDSHVLKYHGYHLSNRDYPGKVALSSLQNSSRNKIIEIEGGKKYQIKGCSGKGGFAQVFKAYVNSNQDEVVALKIQNPPFPWEFYMYRQLDNRITDEERLSYGYAHRVHIYSDYSILVCDYLAHGTLQDAINSYVVTGKTMEDVLSIYYTIEMLRMLETLHSVGIIHGDFKPDNLLIRYARQDLTEHGLCSRDGPWREQGLCLVDWGRGIDLNLFPQDTEFTGDCKTSGFRCIEMQENKPWKFQVDTYGLCAVVHLMLHNKYMEVEKKNSPDGGYIYQPKLPFRRYWNELWKTLFTKLLNSSPGENTKTTLKELRELFQEYLCSDPQRIKKLKQLLLKQKSSLCSA